MPAKKFAFSPPQGNHEGYLIEDAHNPDHPDAGYYRSRQTATRLARKFKKPEMYGLNPPKGESPSYRDDPSSARH